MKIEYCRFDEVTRKPQFRNVGKEMYRFRGGPGVRHPAETPPASAEALEEIVDELRGAVTAFFSVTTSRPLQTGASALPPQVERSIQEVRLDLRRQLSQSRASSCSV